MAVGAGSIKRVSKLNTEDSSKTVKQAEAKKQAEAVPDNVTVEPVAAESAEKAPEKAPKKAPAKSVKKAPVKSETKKTAAKAAEQKKGNEVCHLTEALPVHLL